jgi:hypothetical protein
VVIHAETGQNTPMDRLALIVLLVCGVIATLIVPRLRVRRPPRTARPDVLEIDLEGRDHTERIERDRAREGSRPPA